MSRYTAIRTALIAAAVLKPLLIMAGFLCFAAEVDTTYLLLIVVGFMFVSILPALCVDPVVEHENARRRSGDGMRAYLRAFGIYLVIRWILEQEEVRAFLSAIASRLWDWHLIVAVTLFCVLQLRKELRSALHFNISDLYPRFERVEKRHEP